MRHAQRFLRTVALVSAIMVWVSAPATSQSPSPVPATIQTPNPTSTYLLGPGDTLEVSVWGHPDLTRLLVTIGPDGVIMLPFAGSVVAAGMQVDKLRDRLAKAYADYLIDPKVTVSIKEFRKVRVSVLGQVTRPGTYELLAGARILDFIAAAGGLTDAADVKAAQLMTPGRASKVVDVQRALSGDQSTNLPLRGGETLVVPEDLTNLFTVAGEVARPGRYRIKEGMRVLDALVTGGGLTQLASLTDAKLVRKSGTSEDVSLDSLLLRQDMTANVPLQPGDLLVVPEATNNKFYVMGDVRTPGVFTMKGDVTMLQALAMAGGPAQRGVATAKNVYIVRRGGETQPSLVAGPATTTALSNGHTLITADLQKITQKGDKTADLMLRAGDVVVVPQSGLNSFLSVLSAITGIVRF